MKMCIKINVIIKIYVNQTHRASCSSIYLKIMNCSFCEKSLKHRENNFSDFPFGILFLCCHLA